jgi:hypothetical protein
MLRRVEGSLACVNAECCACVDATLYAAMVVERGACVIFVQELSLAEIVQELDAFWFDALHSSIV